MVHRPCSGQQGQERNVAGGVGQLGSRQTAGSPGWQSADVMPRAIRVDVVVAIVNVAPLVAHRNIVPGNVAGAIAVPVPVTITVAAVTEVTVSVVAAPVVAAEVAMSAMSATEVTTGLGLVGTSGEYESADDEGGQAQAAKNGHGWRLSVLKSRLAV